MKFKSVLIADIQHFTYYLICVRTSENVVFCPLCTICIFLCKCRFNWKNPFENSLFYFSPIQLSWKSNVQRIKFHTEHFDTLKKSTQIYFYLKTQIRPYLSFYVDCCAQLKDADHRHEHHKPLHGSSRTGLTGPIPGLLYPSHY